MYPLEYSIFKINFTFLKIYIFNVLLLFIFTVFGVYDYKFV